MPATGMPCGVSPQLAPPVPAERLDSGNVSAHYSTDSAEVFAEAADELDRVRLRPEVAVEEVPAPTRIAPDALALALRVRTAASDEPLATGRFVLLRDTGEPEAWGGQWRVVCFAQAALEPDLGDDEMLAEVGWSWLIDALAARRVAASYLGGTVTRVLSAGFGQLASDEPSVDLEIRASWSPPDHHVGVHLQAWCDLMCQISGLPPVPVAVPSA